MARSSSDLLDTAPPRQNVVVVHPVRRGDGRSLEQSKIRNPQARLDEAVSLTRAISGLDVVAQELVPVTAVRPATLLGKGAVERLATVIKEAEAGLAMVDTHLSPIQQRNLEKAWSCKVIDRTGLILEIFGERARTREGTLQVELAALSYQKSRLVRSWTHLERQRGGFGFMGGPGETQIEADRRLISERIVRLKKELADVKRTRELHRSARGRVPYPIVALVGYTNAGKSTLFNTLTRATVFAEDLLFATLDPTMRTLVLPSKRKVILSDTVGFISDLPHELVAAFRATLEEVLEADLIVHVQDCSHSDHLAQQADVEEVLREIGLADTVEQGLLQVYNKIDLLSPEDRDVVREQARRHPLMIPMSARENEGIDQFLNTVDTLLAATHQIVTVTVPIARGDILAWLYRHGKIINREDGDEILRLEVRLAGSDEQKLRQLFPDVVEDNLHGD